MKKVAVASMGMTPDAWVGIHAGRCSQFLVFDVNDVSDELPVIVSVPPHPEQPERVSLTALRALMEQNVAVVITGHILDICRQTLETLGIEVIDGVEGLTVREALERYRATGLKTPAERHGVAPRVAVAVHDGGLDAPLEPLFDACTSFLVVDPQTLEHEVVQVEPDGPARRVSLNAVRAVARSGAVALITAHIHPECCMALQALAVTIYLVPAGITARQAIERYRRGELAAAPGWPLGY